MAKRISESNAISAMSQEAIAQRAYEIWESEGRPDGRAMEHWLRAVSELKARDNATEHETPAPKEQRATRGSAPQVKEGRFQTTR